jgi:hypothetical protein
MDDRVRRSNQVRLRELARDHAGEVRVFCAHDPDELRAFTADDTANVPASPFVAISHTAH